MFMDFEDLTLVYFSYYWTYEYFYELLDLLNFFTLLVRAQKSVDIEFFFYIFLL